jgi:hypothetical protein
MHCSDGRIEVAIEFWIGGLLGGGLPATGPEVLFERPWVSKKKGQWLQSHCLKHKALKFHSQC